MSIALPGVTIETIDKSQLSSQLPNIMNIGLSVDVPTGPYTITNVKDKTEYLDLYSINNEISADDHITSLHALKLLQFTPIYVSRAGNSNVLPARADKSDTSGSTLLYVDGEYSPYAKQWKFNLSHNEINSNTCYVVFDVNSIDIDSIITDNDYVINSNGDLTVTENSGTSTKTKYCMYIGEKPNISNISDDNYLKVGNNGSEIDPTLENLFINFNKTIESFNKDIPQLSNLLITNTTISINTGLGLSIIEVFPKSMNFDDNLITSDYYITSYNEYNEDGEYIKRSLGKSAYYSINGITYYNPAGVGTQSYPGTLVELKMYDGFDNNPSGMIIRSSSDSNNNTMSIQDFLVYMNDSQVGSNNTRPVMNDMTASINVGLSPNTGFLDGNDYRIITSVTAELIGDENITRNLSINEVIKTKSSNDNSSPKIDKTTINITSNKYSGSINNIGIKFTMNYGSDDSLYTKYLFMVIGSVYDPNMKSSNTYKMTDVSTLTKFVYRIAEFFSYKNDWLSNNYGKSNLWTVSPLLPDLIYRLSIKDTVNDEESYIKLGEGVISTNPHELSIFIDDKDNGTIDYRGKLLTDYFNNDYKLEVLEVNNNGTDTTESIKYSVIISGTKSRDILLGPNDPISCIVTFNSDGITLVTNTVTYKSYLDKVVSGANFYYLKSSIDSGTISSDLSKYLVFNMIGLSPELEIHNYNIGSTSITNSNKSYDNQYIKITKNSLNSTSYIFYNGVYKYDQLPGESLIRLSPGSLTYTQFMDKLLDELKSRFNCTVLSSGFALYDHDDSVDYIISDHTDMIKLIDRQVTSFTELINNASLIVASKYTNKDNILKFKLDVDNNDPDIYKLTLIRKSSETTYDISFIPNKVNSYGINIYYTYVNDEDNGSRDFYIFRENDVPTNLPEPHVESLLFGGEVLVTPASTHEFELAYDRFKEKLGVYYDILFDAGYSNAVIGNKIHNVGKDIYSLPVLTSPDYYDPNQLKLYRESLGIDHYQGVLQAPRVPDTTLGDFMVYMSPGTQYIERLILNKQCGKEFAPCFYYTNGSTSLKPKFKYNKDSDRSLLINSQISPIVWDRSKQRSYFLLDLTLQHADSSLSDANNVRMINTLSHICDEISQDFIGRFNDEGTRDEYLSVLKVAIDSRMMNNQTYHMNDYRLICDTSNNTKEQIELRNLVLDVYVQFLPGIRYIKVFQSVYKLSQDLNSI